MDNPRKLALESLVKSDTQGCFTNIEINTVLKRAKMEKSDSSLYTLLYLGVMEKKLFLDYIISKYSKSKLDEIDIEALNAIRLGLYQLIFTDRIPDYSAVDESVNLSPKRAKGFVNAILRSFLRNDKRVELPKDIWERASVVASVPMGIVNLFRSSYGDECTLKLLEYNSQDYALSLRVNTLKATKEEIFDYLTNKGFSPRYSKYAPDIIKCACTVEEISHLIDTGKVFIQDESSRVCSIAVDAKSGERVADVCACPGGKTFSMAIDMENKGEILSSDLHKNKLSLIEKGALRLGIDIIKTKEQNAKEYVSDYNQAFDKVLCDVPCSGLGVIFKKPDIKYKNINDIVSLQRVQYDILSNASKYVKIGGYLVYSTCTVCKEENENNVLKFLSENKDFEYADFCVGDVSSQNGMYTFMPHINDTDGFFIAKLKRIK